MENKEIIIEEVYDTCLQNLSGRGFSGSEAINYRSILKRYIDIILDSEGISYLGERSDKPGERFTPKEWEALYDIQDELTIECKNRK